jgi:hypothetical protein
VIVYEAVTPDGRVEPAVINKVPNIWDWAMLNVANAVPVQGTVKVLLSQQQQDKKRQ